MKAPSRGTGGREVAREFLHATLTYGGIDALQLLLGALLIPVYTRAFDVQEYGRVGSLMAVGSLTAVLLGLGIRSAVARMYYDHRDDARALGRFFSSSLGTVAGLGGVMGALIVGVAYLWPGLLAEDVPVSLVSLIVLSSLLGACNGLFLSLFRAARQAALYRWTTLGGFLLATSLILLLVVRLDLGVRGWVYGTLAANGMVFLVLGAHWLRRFGVTWSWTAARQALLFGLPVVPHLLFANALSTSDRLLLQHAVSPAALGAYVLAVQLARPLSALTTSLNAAWQPLAYELHADDPGDPSLGHALTFYAAAMGYAAVAAMAVAPEAMEVLAPPAYAGAVGVFPWIVAGVYVHGLYYVAVNALLRARRPALLPLLSGAALMVQLGFLVAFVPLLGAEGAAMATLGGSAFLVTATLAVAQRVARVEYPWRRVLASLSCVAAGMAVVLLAPSSDRLASAVMRAALLLGMPLALWLSGGVPRGAFAGFRRLLRKEAA